MNVEVVGRICAGRRPEHSQCLQISEAGKTVFTTSAGGASFSFQELFDQNVSTREVFSKTVEPLLNVFAEGMNVCVVLFGATDSGKSYTLNGEQNDPSAIIPLAIDYIFSAADLQNVQATAMWSLSLSMYEIYAEELKDLLQPLGLASTTLELGCNAQDGTFIKGLSRVAVCSVAEAATVYRQGWARRTGAITDFGPASNHSAIITQMNLLLHDHNEVYPSKSFMQIVELPGAETLAEDKNILHSRESPLLSRSLIAFSQVVNNLAKSPDPDRVIDYSDSKLTQLLQEALGGNCKTRVICCLQSNSDPQLLAKVLRTCTDLSQVKNFPVLNEYCVESLMTQYRAHIQALRQEPDQPGNTKERPNKVNTFKDQIWRLNNENVFLRDKNDRLYHKLGELQETMGQLAASKADLSSKLVFSEEEKLNISKDLIDLQIEMNKMREKYEAENFELKNKILILENRAVELEIQKDKCSRGLEMAEDRLQAEDKTRKELVDEYIVLKSNYQALSKEHEKEVSKNEELGLELLNLANSRNSLLKQQDNYTKSRAIYEEAAEELSRVRSLVAQLSREKIKPEEVVASEYERSRVEKNLLGNRDEIKEQIEMMKKNYEEQQHAMEERIVKMGKELQEAKRAIRNTQHKLSEQSVALLNSQSHLKETESENSRLQLHLKELNEEYRLRLVHYIQDITDYVDNTARVGHDKPPGEQPYLKRFVDSMLKDIRSAYKSREEQLASAARNYKKRMKDIYKKHEMLLIAYRSQREQILGLKNEDLDVGPAEVEFAVTDSELLSGQAQELNRLREDKACLESQLRNHLEKTKLSGGYLPTTLFPLLETSGKVNDGNWMELKKQIREFTLTTQNELESERGQLNTRLKVTEAQLAELQDYVDKHLGRYKEEIVRLRKLVGSEGPQNCQR